MSQYLEHPEAGIDLSILDRISETEVAAWMVARVHKLRLGGFEVGSMELDCWVRDYRSGRTYDTSFKAHGGGQFAYAPNIRAMLKELRQKQADDPAGKAMERRSKARRLLKEAERLEEIAREISKDVEMEGGEG